jgi:hypothetical protein
MSTRTAAYRKTSYHRPRLIAAAISITACALLTVAWIISALDNRPVDINWLFQTQQSHGPRIDQTSSGYVLTIPHWLPILVTGALALALAPSIMVALSSRLLATFSRALGAIARIRPPRRFSLRALLVASTLTALLLGMVAVLLR